MKNYDQSNDQLIRSGARIRESIRCLPRGHFEQIRQMFDNKKSSKTTERQEQQRTNIDDLILQTDQDYENVFSKDAYSSYTKIVSRQIRSSNEHKTSSPRFPMASAVNYAESYETSPISKDARQYVSSLRKTLAVHAKPVLVKTTTNHSEKQIPFFEERNNHQGLESSKRILSAASLSSTGYDSNSSPSIFSKRNSLNTNHSQDFSISSDERSKTKAWISSGSNLCTPGTIGNSYSSDNISDSPPLMSRSNIRLIHSPTSTLDRRPISVVRHTMIGNCSIPGSPSISSTSSSTSAKFVVQTTSFPTNLRRKHSNSRSAVFTPIVVQKQVNQREESPLPVVENPLFQQTNFVPPQKPPRTFEHDTRYDQKVSSSSSSSTSHSPIFDLGARSVSCMDLTAGVSNVLLSSGLLPLKTDEIKSRKENIYEELKPPPTYIPSKSKFKTKENLPKTSMKKGISEPNLAKTKFFSPRSLLDRFKRILPLSLSKQSLNDLNTMTIESDDDSDSLTSDIHDQYRSSRLDHVNRINQVYDTLPNETQLMNSFPERQLTTLFDYIVHLIPEEEFGFFANGTGCLSTSNIHLPSTNSSSIRFKYPYNAQEESTLKYFCFPDQHDSNNNQRILPSYALLKRTKPEYFRFTLTNMYGKRQYGYCSRFIHKGHFNALCLVSPCDMINLYEKILATATELFLSYKEEEAKIFFKEIYPHRLPARGDMIHIHTTTVGLYTLNHEYDRRKQLIDSVTLLRLSTDTIIKIFSSILYEQKVLFIGNELGPLTRLINTFVTLLYPFSWLHTYIPILPPLMLDVLQAPTPYIIGILRSSEGYLSGNNELSSQDNSDILIVDIDHDRIRSINDYFYTETSRHNSFDNLNTHLSRFQILPKMFKIKLKQEISLLRKNQSNFSLDECQQRLQNLFMSIFIETCYNYQDYFDGEFCREQFLQSKSRTIETFLEWFTRTQMFQIFIRQKFETKNHYQFALTFDLACEKYRRTFNKQPRQRITVKAVKRKAAIRTNNRF